MPFQPDDLAAIGATEEVRIETSADGGPAHRTIVWIVVVDDAAYVRSYRGPEARWYREALADPDVGLHVQDRLLACRAVVVDDPSILGAVSAELERKYAGDPATPSMVRPEVVALTLRLDPR